SSDSPASAYHTVHPSQDKTLTLRDAARVTGISPDTICQWEDGEHLFTSQRTRTGQRRYNADVIQRLFTIRKLEEQGLPMHHIYVVMDEMAHAITRARRDVPHPLATTQRFFSVLSQVDREIFDQLVALSKDPTSTPNDTLVMIGHELEIIQP